MHCELVPLGGQLEKFDPVLKRLRHGQKWQTE
jgi:hypothetical protein